MRRVAVVTGASAGLGAEVARALAANGTTVIRASRRGDVRLDLASQASVRAAAAEIRSRCERLDLLVNNAGVMDVPQRRTEDGFELTLATNHLGHFALTGLLLDRLRATPRSRIVTVSSAAHRRGVIRFDDLQSERGYDAAAAYAQSKLANLLFTFELQSRLEAIGAATIALAAHPGNARTGLWRSSSRIERALIRLPRLAQSAAGGARPILRAALDPAARGGDFFGPKGRYAGSPVRVEPGAAARDPGARRRLWEVSERLTGVTYPGADAAPVPPR